MEELYIVTKHTSTDGAHRTRFYRFDGKKFDVVKSIPGEVRATVPHEGTLCYGLYDRARCATDVFPLNGEHPYVTVPFEITGLASVRGRLIGSKVASAKQFAYRKLSELPAEVATREGIERQMTEPNLHIFDLINDPSCSNPFVALPPIRKHHGKQSRSIQCLIGDEETLYFAVGGYSAVAPVAYFPLYDDSRVYRYPFKITSSGSSSSWWIQEWWIDEYGRYGLDWDEIKRSCTAIRTSKCNIKQARIMDFCRHDGQVLDLSHTAKNDNGKTGIYSTDYSKVCRVDDKYGTEPVFEKMGVLTSFCSYSGKLHFIEVKNGLDQLLTSLTNTKGDMLFECCKEKTAGECITGAVSVNS